MSLQRARSVFEITASTQATVISLDSELRRRMVARMQATKISDTFRPTESIVMHEGDCLDLVRSIPNQTVQLVVTSPPYNLGKSYERRQTLDAYLELQRKIIGECVRVLKDEGSLCWQVGNFVEKKGASSIVPLDIALFPIFTALGLRLRNRIVWHFEHGLHCSNRFSGRYETILWFTKTDAYHFDLDPIRVPQKYPGKKYFRGPKAGQYSCNPLGKNPGDLWTIPNVKSNHVEKTVHPCQFPVELVERLVLSMTRPGEWVFDPFMGVGSALAAAVKHGRKAVGAEIMPDYVTLARERVLRAVQGTLPTRPMNKPVYDPKEAGNKLTIAPWATVPYLQPEPSQLVLLEKRARYDARPA